MLHAMNDEPVEKAMLPVSINRTFVPMEVDTGAAATIVPKGRCKLKLKKSWKRLKSVTGQVFKLAGQATVTARVGKVTRHLTIYVAEDSNCIVLFGRDWISAFFGRNWVKA